MEITEVRIKLMDGTQDRLLGFCSITIDQAFVIRDLKIIRGGKGPFVAMPSRKLTDRCPTCSGKNHLRAAHCSQCGVVLDDDRSFKTPDGRAKLYADIAHPINADCRDLIQQRVLVAYEEELVLAQRPDYVCRYDDFGESDYESFDSWDEDTTPVATAPGPHRRIDFAAPSSVSSRALHRGTHERAATQVAVNAEAFGEGVF